MDKLGYAGACFLLSLILGGTWGAFLYWLFPSFGLIVGLILFGLCFVILMRIDSGPEELTEFDYAEQKRRFNDV